MLGQELRKALIEDERCQNGSIEDGTRELLSKMTDIAAVRHTRCGVAVASKTARAAAISNIDREVR